MQIELPADDQLLLVPAGQRPRGQRRIRGADVERVDDLIRAAADRLAVEKDSARRHRLAIVHPEDRILREIEVEQQAALVPVFGDLVKEDREIRRAMALASLRESWRLAEEAGGMSDEEIDAEISEVRAARQLRNAG